MTEIALNTTPSVYAAVCYLGMRDDVINQTAILNFGKCIIEQGTNRRIAVENEVMVRLTDQNVMVGIQDIEAAPTLHAQIGKYSGFGKTSAEITAIANEFVLPLYQ